MKCVKGFLMSIHQQHFFSNRKNDSKMLVKSKKPFPLFFLLVLFAWSFTLCDQSLYTSSKAEAGAGLSVNSLSWSNSKKDFYYSNVVIDVMLNPIDWFTEETTRPILNNLDCFIDLQIHNVSDSMKLDEFENSNTYKQQLLFQNPVYAFGIVLKYQTLSFLDLFVGVDYMFQSFRVIEVQKISTDSIVPVSNSGKLTWNGFVGTLGFDLFVPEYPQVKLSFNMNIQQNKNIHVSTEEFGDISMKKEPLSFVFTAKYSFRKQNEMWSIEEEAKKEFNSLCQKIQNTPSSIETKNDVQILDYAIDDAWNIITHTSSRERQYTDAKNTLRDRINEIKKEEYEKEVRIKKEKHEKEVREFQYRLEMLQEKLDTLDSIDAEKSSNDLEIIEIIKTYDDQFIQYKINEYRGVSKKLISEISSSDHVVYRLLELTKKLSDTHFSKALNNELTRQFHKMSEDSSRTGRFNLFSSFKDVSVKELKDSLYVIAINNVKTDLLDCGEEESRLNDFIEAYSIFGINFQAMIQQAKEIKQLKKEQMEKERWRRVIQEWKIENKKSIKRLYQISSRTWESIIHRDRIGQKLNRYSIYRLFGEIQNVNGNVALIWGVSIPEGSTSGYDPGTSYDEGNLKVFGYQNEHIAAGNQYTGGEHCFLSKEIGTGRLGQNVDVRVYGSCEGRDKLLDEYDREVKVIQKQEERIQEIKDSINFDRMKTVDDSLGLLEFSNIKKSY